MNIDIKLYCYNTKKVLPTIEDTQTLFTLELLYPTSILNAIIMNEVKIYYLKLGFSLYFH
jgi:hypothetical protein